MMCLRAAWRWAPHSKMLQSGQGREACGLSCRAASRTERQRVTATKLRIHRRARRDPVRFARDWSGAWNGGPWSWSSRPRCGPRRANVVRRANVFDACT